MELVQIGSLAASTAEPCQIRKEAALRRPPRVTRFTWFASVPWACFFVRGVILLIKSVLTH